MSRLLDFLLVGAPRCGTTTLFHHLRRHCELFIPAGKELPFFSEQHWLEEGWDAFSESYYTQASERLRWGKITPQYWLDPDVPRRIARTMPDVKLLMLLRDPIERAYSHHRLFSRHGRETRPFAEVALDPENHNYWAYVPPGEYDRILMEYFKYFERDKCLVLFTEDLANRPAEVLSKIQDFLGLEQPFPSEGLNQRHHVGGTSARMPRLRKLLRRMPPVQWVWNALPERHRAALSFWYLTRFAAREEPPDSLSPAVRERLEEHYRPHDVGLEKLLGRSVPWLDCR